MNFTNPNTGAYVWSRTAGDIVLNGIVSSSPVTFTVFVNGTSAAVFDLVPVSYKITIRFSEILEAVLPRNNQAFPATTVSRYNYVTIRAAQGSETEDTDGMYCFRGGSDVLQSAFPHGTHWLTWKPQVTRTFAWAKEYLSFIQPASSSRNVNARVYLSNGSSVVVTLGTFPSENVLSIGTVNCSLSRIQGFSSVTGKTVLAYDVYTSNILAHRFIVKPIRLRQREFLFVNSLGVLDTVFATGDVSRDTECEIATARINGQDVELTNDAVEHFKVNSGGLRKRRDMDQWQEFFRSTDRWVLLQGDVIRRIVIDSVEPDMTEHRLSGVNFTYHYADRFTGRYYDDSALPAFDPSDIDL